MPNMFLGCCYASLSLVICFTCIVANYEVLGATGLRNAMRMLHCTLPVANKIKPSRRHRFGSLVFGMVGVLFAERLCERRVSFLACLHWSNDSAPCLKALMSG